VGFRIAFPSFNRDVDEAFKHLPLFLKLSRPECGIDLLAIRVAGEETRQVFLYTLLSKVVPLEI